VVGALIVCALAAYRVTRRVMLENGYFGVWRRLRKWAGVIETWNTGPDGSRAWDVTVSRRVGAFRRSLAETLICHWCVGVPIALLCVALSSLRNGAADTILLALAVMGAAGIVYELVDKGK